MTQEENEMSAPMLGSQRFGDNAEGRGYCLQPFLVSGFAVGGTADTFSRDLASIERGIEVLLDGLESEGFSGLPRLRFTVSAGDGNAAMRFISVAAFVKATDTVATQNPQRTAPPPQSSGAPERPQVPR
jgi:hypothetical protein